MPTTRLSMLALAAVAVALMALGTPAREGAGAAPADALVVLNTSDIAAFNAAIETVGRAGGRVPQAYAPSAFVAELPPGAESALRARHGIAAIERGRADIAALKRHGRAAEQAGEIWNAVYRGNVRDPLPVAPSPHPHGETAFARPAYASAPGSAPGGGGGAPPASGGSPSALQTSEFMAGSAAYTVIFVESDGGMPGHCPTDTETEDWDAPRQAAMLSQISAGMSFWTSRSGAPSPLTFVMDNQGVRTTSCEPINRTSGFFGDEGKWIADILTGFGQATTPTNYIAEAASFANARRIALGTDWAFTIFVVDSENDADGLFTDGKFAYAYLNGPFIVMTYDNDGWGIAGSHYVTAHETGHIFGALDEYPGSNCSTSDSWGYFNVPNASCNNGGITSDLSIMGPSGEQVAPGSDISVSAREAIGWRNPSGNIVDVVRTAAAAITPFVPDPASDDTPTYSGNAGNVPFTPGAGCNTQGGICYRTPSPVTISRAVSAEWNVDAGAFSSSGVVADDGAFDEENDPFTFTPPPTAPGLRTFGVRTTNHFGHTSGTVTDTLTIDTGPCLDIDTDGDGICNLYDLDDDNDFCSDGEESDGNQLLGGLRDPLDYWDFFDVTGNSTIDLGDTLVVLQHFGHIAADPQDNVLDRHVPLPATPWRTAEANNGVDLIDALASLQSFGHDCSSPP